MITFFEEHEDDTKMMKDDPINFPQVMESANSQKWIDTMNKKIKFIKDNDVWNLIPLSEGAKFIGCKWIFKIKKNLNSNVKRYKAYFVAKGRRH